MSLFLLEAVVQHYAWGDDTTIPDLLGVKNDAKQPYAELWFGTHPRGESLAGTRRLSEILGARLPYLFKVLAVRSALSIQVHPNREQAQEGFAREEQAGVPVDAPQRNYRDTNHKPELLLALDDFWGLSSFCDFQRAREGMRHFPLPAELLDAGTLDDFFRRFLELPSAAFDFPALLAAARSVQEAEMDRHWWIQELFRQYGADRGVLSPLFLNLVHLAPGQAIYLDACELHAYLRGTGIEIMAASDNVLRFGCTKKHVDPEELLRVVRCVAKKPAIVHATEQESFSLWPTGAKEFELARCIVRGESISYRCGVAAEILLCIAGELRVALPHSKHHTLTMRRGQACAISSEASLVTLSGTGTAYRAALPRRLDL